MCGSLSARAECERHPSGGPPGRELCAWLGGSCVAASAADCTEPPRASSEPDYYGEEAGFRRSCGSGPRAECSGLRGALEQYAHAHTAATRDAHPPGGLATARLLVIRDHWRNVGMGFMPSHVATVVLFALYTGVYVYVENYGRYDWTRYFFGHAGLDLRWTAAKARLWKGRFATAGLSRTLVEVWLASSKSSS